MTKKQFTYEIGERTYIQRPLVLGQMRQLISTMQGLVIPADIDTIGLVSVLGDKLPLALAIVLTPLHPPLSKGGIEGSYGAVLKDKDIPALANELEFAVTPEQTLQVIEDFFSCNQISLFLESIGKMTEKISTAMTKTKETGSHNSSASSQEETLQKETQYSGTTH